MAGAAQAVAIGQPRVGDWIKRHPGSLLLGGAAILGLVAMPAVAAALQAHDVLLSGKVSLVASVWLVIAIVLAFVCLVARSGLSRDLSDGFRAVLALSSAGAPPSRTVAAGADVPSLGASIVQGIFDLVVLLIVQGIVRKPLVDVVAAYEPKAIVDGVFVVLVVLVALAILFGLHHASQPLTEYLVSSGLDRLVPTSGFAASNLPDNVPTRAATRTPSGATRGAAEPTVAAGAPGSMSDAPTVAAAATIAASGEATVADPRGPAALSAEATIAAPPGSPAASVSPFVDLAPGGAQRTRADTAAPPPSTDPPAAEPTVLEDPAPLESAAVDVSRPEDSAAPAQRFPTPANPATPAAQAPPGADATLGGDATLIPESPEPRQANDRAPDRHEGQ